MSHHRYCSSSHPTYILRLTGLFIHRSCTTGSGESAAITVTPAGNSDAAPRICCVRSHLLGPSAGGNYKMSTSESGERVVAGHEAHEAR